MSQKKSGHERHDYKVSLLYIYIVGFIISPTKYQRPINMQTIQNFTLYIYTYGLYSLITLK